MRRLQPINATNTQTNANTNTNTNSFSSSVSSSSTISITNSATNSLTLSYSQTPIPTFTANSNSATYSAYPTLSATQSAVYLRGPTYIAVEDNITFPKLYFLYVGLPVGLLLLCFFGYIYDLKTKYVKLKKYVATERAPTLNVARSPLRSIQPFSIP